MALFSCFAAIARRKKRNSRKDKNGLKTLVESSDRRDTFISKNSRCKVKVMSHDSPPVEGKEERDEESTHNNLQEFQFQTPNANPSEPFVAELDAHHHDHDDFDATQNGHLSDPGTRAEHWASPKLKRSCSSLDTREVLRKMAKQLPRTKSQLSEQLQGFSKKDNEDVAFGTPLSHTSAMTHFSADKVMLKKRSSSQILPSRSRKLWWKLFLWSHRNLQKPKTRPANDTSLNQLGGYSSDTLEPGRMKEIHRPGTPESKNDDDKWSDHRFEGGGAGFWPENQWLAFSMQSSPLQRVDEWVKDLQVQPSDLPNELEKDEYGIEFPPSPHKELSCPTTPLSADVSHANSVIKSLNSSSTVAHISGMGLKVIPDISHFFRLRSVNLSNNSIAHISIGHLPKGLHMLDLSRNKISNIEGLRELTRLRVLNLSYNRISRISHGLSKCVLLKELYLSGNKIGDVEGLHRLLKLTVLDLSFNKITTTKGLGQLVANYSSLLALNLLGNPVQSNLSEDQLRKAVCGLLPKLAYLNKEPINQQKAREVATDIVVKASSSSGSWSGRRRAVRKAGHGGGSGSSSVGQRRGRKVKGRGQQQSNLRMKTPA